jgi:hypothetical protein
MKILSIGVCALMIATIAVTDSRAQEPYGDAQVMLEFVRAADSYAFSHRQTDRRGAPAKARLEGSMFTPMVAQAFRARIARAAAAADCRLPAASQTDFVVPVVNGASAGSRELPSCVGAMLPRLPAELEYRVSGVALLLADAHLEIVVDVVHGAFPARDN